MKKEIFNDIILKGKEAKLNSFEQVCAYYLVRVNVVYLFFLICSCVDLFVYINFFFRFPFLPFYSVWAISELI